VCVVIKKQHVRCAVAHGLDGLVAAMKSEKHQRRISSVVCVALKSSTSGAL